MKMKALAVVLAFGTLGFASGASALTVSCPDPALSGSRVFSVTTTGSPSCLTWGTGNINGTAIAGVVDPIVALGYLFLNKSDNDAGLVPGSLTGTSNGAPSGLTTGLSGTFSLTSALLANYTDFVIAFKSGVGQLDPDWAAFTIPDGVTSGSWTISGNQALSHANLYGRLSTIPLPAAAWLLLTVVGGLGYMKHRRRDAV